MTETFAIVSLLGLALGSFLNSCAYRLPRKISLVTVRSFCPHCGHGLSWYELIPLVSFVLQKGRCRSCSTRISWQYPVIEVLVAAMLVVSGSWFKVQGVLSLCFVLLMILIAIIDFRHFVIPNILIAVGLVVGVGWVMVIYPGGLLDSLISAVGSFLLMLTIKAGGDNAFGQESMGMGDVKLAGVVGLFLGFVPFLVALWGSSLAGTVYGLVRKRTHPPAPLPSPREGGVRPARHFCGGGLSGQKVPFGSFLALGSLFVFLFNEEVSAILKSWLTSIP